MAEQLSFIFYGSHLNSKGLTLSFPVGSLNASNWTVGIVLLIMKLWFVMLFHVQFVPVFDDAMVTACPLNITMFLNVRVTIMLDILVRIFCCVIYNFKHLHV